MHKGPQTSQLLLPIHKSKEKKEEERRKRKKKADGVMRCSGERGLNKPLGHKATILKPLRPSGSVMNRFFGLFIRGAPRLRLRSWVGNARQPVLKEAKFLIMAILFLKMHLPRSPGSSGGNETEGCFGNRCVTAEESGRTGGGAPEEGGGAQEASSRRSVCCSSLYHAPGMSDANLSPLRS